jgi:translocation and assembly module TamB
MKIVLRTILVLLVVLVAFLTYAANSGRVVRILFDRFAPQYGLSCQTIRGSFFEGVTLRKLRFHDRIVIDETVLQWRPISLLFATVDIGTIRTEGVDVDALRSMLRSFEKKSRSSDKDGEKSDAERAYFLPSIHISDLHIDTKPFDLNGTHIEALSLDGSELTYTDAKPTWYDLSLHLRSDLVNIGLSTSLRKEVWHIRHLEASELNVTKLQRIVERFSSKKSENRDEKATTQDAFRIPGTIWADRIRIESLPVRVEPFYVRKTAATLEAVKFDIENLRILRAAVAIDVSSNFADVHEKGSVRDNVLDAAVTVRPKRALFEHYRLPLRPAAFERLKILIDADKNGLSARMRTRLPQLLLADDNATFPLSIDRADMRFDIVWRTMNMKASADVNASSPFAPKLSVHTDVYVEGNEISYTLHGYVPQIVTPDANISALLEDMQLDLNGTAKRLYLEAKNDALVAMLDIPDLNGTGVLKMKTRRALDLKHFVRLPEPLERARAQLGLNLPVNMRNLSRLHGTWYVDSSLVDVNGTLLFAEKEKRIDAKIDVPQDSLLRTWNDKIHWRNIAPVHFVLKERNGTGNVSIRSEHFRGDGVLDIRKGDVRASLQLGGLNAEALGNIADDILVETHVDSFERLAETLGSFYDIADIPQIGGKLDLSVVLSPKGNSFMTLHSPQITYRAGRASIYHLDELDVVLRKRKDSIVLDAYRFVLDDRVFYASVPSKVRLSDTDVTIDAFWINDALKISGELDTKRMKGEIRADADRFAYRDEYVDLNASVALKMSLNGEETSVEGDIVLLKTRILYDLNTKHFPSDSDIVIVQEHVKAKRGGFYDNLSVSVHVTNDEPIVYEQGPLHISANADITIFKAPHDDVLILGSIDLIDGGTYIFQGKRFYVENSHIYLTGDPSEPVLDIKVKYKAMRHDVTIMITGTPTIPNVIFSSVPYLTREQILSLILFDTVEGGEGNADTMMKMMGGAMAKAALGDLGVSIDHLVFGADNSVEVGKKISEKTTVIYINGTRPRVELKYKYSPHFEIVVGADERSESVDVVYKRDFSDSDIVIEK